MNLDSLYDIAEKENIKVYDWFLEDINGMYMNYENINAIALNYNRLGTYINEKCTLAEELRTLLYGRNLSRFLSRQNIDRKTRI